MAKKPTIRERLASLIDRFTADIRSSFLASIQDIVDNVVLADMVAAIEAGDVIAAYQAAGFSAAAMRPLTAAVERAFETGGVTIGETFPKTLNTATGRAVFRFDVRNSRAEKQLREHSAGLVSQVSESARTNIRNTMFEGVKAGDNPRRTALDIVGRKNPTTGRREGGVIGLTTNQERWVVNTRDHLNDVADFLKDNPKLKPSDHPYFQRELRNKGSDGIVKKAIAEGKPLPRDTVDKLVGKYKDNALKYRGNTIARTEALHALNASEFEAYNQAVDMGAVKSNNVLRYWDSAGNDGRTRDSHLKMDHMPPVKMGEPFKTPGGASLMFPGDTSLGAPAKETIQCRCRVRTKVDWLADIY